MALAQKLLGNHQHGDGSGGVITHPRGYELFTNLFFLGRRARVFDRFVTLAGAQHSERVLDIGCGTGYSARRIAPAVGPGGAVVGIDPSKPMLDYASGHTPANCTFHAAGAEDLPFGDASFDDVISSLVYHHFPLERRADGVREMFRVLRPGGRLLIADFRPLSSAILNRIIAAITAHAMAHNNAGQLAELITNAGFTISGSGERRPLHYVTAQRPKVR